MIVSDSLAEGIAERLRAAREHAGLSQGQVARLLHYHRPTISEIESGRRRVKGEEIAKLADLYAVSATWLLKGTPEIENPSAELAARELSKLKKEDLEAVIHLLRVLRKV
ncbi:MAG: helix-turn-helix transcriptional regulator [Candidatus Bathyarchaeota archaeon]|nr:helix-turn-helix transcriptional regulator [Candidatus Bathyarchaeota archaeon]